ncbi:MAG: hypothetical protein KDB86_01800 [Actinobacteria bacterium]|nr:hypothetical protein [Actinomycetota bacterium]MCB9390898.1 hypothetical protein [Acidimicrobiia bacterium]
MDETDATLAQANPEQSARLMERLFGAEATWSLPVEQLIAGEGAKWSSARPAHAGIPRVG